MKDASKHPCFNVEAKGKYGRVHLPVAPKCNIQCGYCNRKYDCVNESRPGVTSAVLNPQQSLEYIRAVKEKEPRISVTGIAGPGDPFANPEEVMESLRLISGEYPDMIYCLSTNGLNLYPYIEEIAELGVTHVTITINTIDPEVGAKIYPWIRFEKRVYRKEKGARLLLDQQLKCITKLKEMGVTVKINSIVIPGVNDHCIVDVAEKVSELGADMFNCIPLIPTEDTKFEGVAQPSKDMVAEIQAQAEKFLPQMRHCKRCRADAVGLLGKDDHGCMSTLQSIAFPKPSENRPYVAVATYEGLLVNQHLGDADDFQIYEYTGSEFRSVERRPAAKRGSGDDRWQELADTLKDCGTLLVSGVGPKPLSVLKKNNINVIEMTGLIEEGLKHVYEGTELKTVRKRDMFRCGSECSGNGLGCG